MLQFLVDGLWAVSDCWPTAHDARGNINNVIHVNMNLGGKEVRPLDQSLRSKPCLIFLACLGLISFLMACCSRAKSSCNSIHSRRQRLAQAPVLRGLNQAEPLPPLFHFLHSILMSVCMHQKADALFLHAQLSAAVQRYARRGRSAARLDSLVRRRLERELEEARAYANMLLDRAQVRSARSAAPEEARLRFAMFVRARSPPGNRRGIRWLSTRRLSLL
jgi:hypothetical protein